MKPTVPPREHRRRRIRGKRTKAEKKKKLTIREPFFANPRVPIGRHRRNGSCRPHWCQPKPVGPATVTRPPVCSRAHTRQAAARSTRSLPQAVGRRTLSRNFYVFPPPHTPRGGDPSPTHTPGTTDAAAAFANLKPRLLTAGAYFLFYSTVLSYPPPGRTSTATQRWPVVHPFFLQ